ncbi:MAG: oligosaccharide flippase family protein, partial [Cyanobacteria bacterium]|nr:oligosaccharide flippase family protein [Cyanobacteriota bacterium]
VGGRIVLIFGIIILLLLLILSFPVANYLQVNDVKLLFLIAFIIFFTILSSLTGGILQGELRFISISLLSVFSAFLKVAVGILLLFLGFRIFGVLIAIFLSALIPFIIVLAAFYKYYKNKPSSTKLIDKVTFLKEFKNYSYKFFLSTVGITILTTTDVIFARHFFKPDMAGQYAALSIMGKSIFYFASPVYFVFFPLIASKKEKKEKLYETLFMGIGIITIISVAMSFVYFLFPTIVLRIFFPAKEYSMLAPYLGPFSLYIIVFSIAILFNNFLLSIGKTGIYIINLLVSFLFIALMYTYNRNFYQVIGVLFVTSFLLIICQLSYYYLSVKAERSK